MKPKMQKARSEPQAFASSVCRLERAAEREQGMHGDYSKARRKSTKLVALPNKLAPTLRLGGAEPTEDMQPGPYRVACTGAAVERGRVVIHYEVIDGVHTGTELKQWIAIPASGQISPKSRYARECAVALGREIDKGDNLNNPAAIFRGLIFSVEAGFRKTDSARGGKFSEENALRRKDSADGLRVHVILALESL